MKSHEIIRIWMLCALYLIWRLDNVTYNMHITWPITGKVIGHKLDSISRNQIYQHNKTFIFPHNFYPSLNVRPTEVSYSQCVDHLSVPRFRLFKYIFPRFGRINRRIYGISNCISKINIIILGQYVLWFTFLRTSRVVQQRGERTSL